MKKLSQFNEEISYQIVYKKIKNLWMRINNKNEIVVSVPIGTKNYTIEKFVNKHIEKFVKHIEEKNTKTSINLKDKYFYLFGKQVFFQISEDLKKIILIQMQNKRINIGKKTLEEAIETYRKKELKTYLIIRQLQLQKIMNIENHLIFVRDKSTAWATNHVTKNKIYYSNNLASFSKEIIDYVIVHELAHNKFLNHSKDFWKYVSIYEPKYKEKKLKLKKYIYL